MSNNTDIIFPINRIELSPLSNDELRRMSVARKMEFGLNVPETVTKGEPTVGGVSDPALGSTNASRDCNTCGLDSNGCECHMGHVTLPVPMYNPVFIAKTRKLLACICLECSRIPLLTDSNGYKKVMTMKTLISRADEFKKQVNSVKACPFCKSQIPNIRKDAKEKKDKKDKDIDVLTIYAEYITKVIDDDQVKKEVSEIFPLSSNDVYQILDNMSDQTISAFLIDPLLFRPSDMCHYHWPISAPSIRPSVKADYLADGTNEDDLTKKSLDVVRQCDKIKGLIDSGKYDKAEKLFNFLQSNINVFAVGSKNTNDNKGTKVIKSISQRIQGKEGRLRQTLAGKRTNYCARSVISSDPMISISEGGIPLYVAMTLTIRVTVRKENILELSKYVKNGRYVYPGANYVKHRNSPDNVREDTKNTKNFINLQYGDIVERHLQDGDPILFNRQPSLHKLGIMCHRARIIRNPSLSIFRLNVNVTEPYGADFDGDEMNIYLAQDAQCMTEYYLLANVDKHILSPAYSTPIMKFKQDTPSGLYAMTDKNNKIDWHYAMNTSMHIEGSVSVSKKNDLTSHELFSELIPEMINYTNYDDDGNKLVEIINGKLISGIITGAILVKGLIMAIWDRHGPTKTRIFIDNAQKMAEMIIFYKGISIGYKDTISTPEISQATKEEIYGKMIEGKKMLTEIENNPELLDYETFETVLFRCLDSARSNVSSICMKKLTSENMFYLHVISGAKGKPDNIGAIMGAIGQQHLKLGRIGKSVNHRSLPHICKDDDTPRARGYIVNSYKEGADPIEYWQYHSSGREGIINTAIGTADTGYQQRRLVKAMESIKCENDGTIRTSDGIILQFLYGDNQLDQVKQKRIKFKSMNMNNEKIRKIHLFNEKDLSAKSILNNKQFVKDLLKMRDKMRIIQVKSRMYYGTFMTEFYQGANYPRIINDIINLSNHETDIVDPDYVLKQIEHILSHKSISLVCYVDDEHSPIKSANEKKYKFLIRYGLYEFLSPKRCVSEYKLSKKKFDRIVKEIIGAYISAIVHSGEMVGIVAAQSMGEPLTQMTLSSFHKAGAGEAGLRGAPRIKEILGNGKIIATPIMYIYFKEEFRKDKKLVERIASNLNFTTCLNIVSRLETRYDPNNINSKTDDIDLTSVFDAKNGTKDVDLKTYPWLFRIHIIREKMLEYNISMLDIKTKFVEFWKENSNSNKKIHKHLFSQIANACISSNNDNSEKPMLHVRLELSDIDDKTLSEFAKLVINKFHIKGDDKITSIDRISDDDIYTFDDKTGDVNKEIEYVIYANGINLEKLKDIPYIDQNRTTCNDIRTITSTYGIESTRSVLYKEIKSIFTETPMNPHHVSITCDFMTHSGNVISVDRFGLRKLNTGVLAKATFEESMDLLTDAAFYNQSDILENVSSSILLGKPFNGGTGLCNLMMDTDELEKSEFNDSNSMETGSIGLMKMPLINDILGKSDSTIVTDLYMPDVEML